MTAINATQDTVTGAPAIENVWSAGDYDRLASYGSAPEAAHLVRFAGVQPGDHVLDVGTGSGLVAIIAAQRRARVMGVDPTRELLAKAHSRDAATSSGTKAWRSFCRSPTLPSTSSSVNTRTCSVRSPTQPLAKCCVC